MAVQSTKPATFYAYCWANGLIQIGKLLVPGIPEAENQQAAGDALKAFINWLKTGRRFTPGISFGTMR